MNDLFYASIALTLILPVMLTMAVRVAASTGYEGLKNNLSMKLKAVINQN